MEKIKKNIFFSDECHFEHIFGLKVELILNEHNGKKGDKHTTLTIDSNLRHKSKLPFVIRIYCWLEFIALSRLQATSLAWPFVRLPGQLANNGNYIVHWWRFRRRRLHRRVSYQIGKWNRDRCAIDCNHAWIQSLNIFCFVLMAIANNTDIEIDHSSR